MPKIKLLLNENIGIKTANFLKAKNYDIKSTIQEFSGISDKRLLEIAIKENWIIVTLDKDFAYLVFRENLPSYGIILLRLRNEYPEIINKILASFLDNNKQDLSDKFVVLDEIQARIRQIPKQ